MKLQHVYERKNEDVKVLTLDMIIIDDVFYLAPMVEELTTFYKAVNFMSETHSLVIVTNRNLSGYGAGPSRVQKAISKG